MNKINWLRILIFTLLLVIVTYLFFQLENQQSILQKYAWIFFYPVYIFSTLFGGMIGFGIGLIVEMFALYGIAALLEKVITKIFFKKL